MQITGNLVLKERPGVHLQQMRDWILDSQSLSRILREKNSQGRGCCKMQSAFFSSFCLSSLGRRRKPLNAALWRRFKVAVRWWFLHLLARNRGKSVHDRKNRHFVTNWWMDTMRIKLLTIMMRGMYVTAHPQGEGPLAGVYYLVETDQPFPDVCSLYWP